MQGGCGDTPVILALEGETNGLQGKLASKTNHTVNQALGLTQGSCLNKYG